MTKAIRIHEHGAPEVMLWEEVTLANPGPGLVHLRHTAVGLNYIDVYHRTGLYPLGELPATPLAKASTKSHRAIELPMPACRQVHTRRSA